MKCTTLHLKGLSLTYKPRRGSTSPFMEIAHYQQAYRLSFAQVPTRISLAHLWLRPELGQLAGLILLAFLSAC